MRPADFSRSRFGRAAAWCAVVLQLMLVCSCVTPGRAKPEPLAMEYQGRASSYFDQERNRSLSCDVPPELVNPGPYPYRFRTPNDGAHYLLFSLALFATESRIGNRVLVIVDGQVLEAYSVGGPRDPVERIEIMPENPSVLRMENLKAGDHTLEFKADDPGGCCVIHWGVANDAAMETFWNRRNPWLDNRR